jgi:Fe-S cluster assembly protein SufD
MSATEHTGRYLTAFKDWQSTAKGHAPSRLTELRQAGIASFASLGFPTPRDEDWKYTNIEPVISRPFGPVNGAAKTLSGEPVLANAFVEEDIPRLVFVNGVYAPLHSSVRGLPGGARVTTLRELFKTADITAAPQIGQHANYRRNSLVALNTAFLDDGAAVVIAPGCRLSRPIHVVYASGAGEHPVVSYPRTLILLGAGSEASIVESYASINDGTYLANAVTELIGESDAVVHHYRVQREGAAGFHLGTLAAHLGRGCHLTAHAVTLSGALVRNDVQVSLDGEGAECVLNGLYLGAGKQHIDNFTEIEHVKPRATSLELYKGILDGSSRGVFNGKIVVHKDAQKSDARQTNRNLLLSPDAAVNTKPQLEIHADDVKCSHGSTIGQLDPDALFYLRSRGLDPDEARSLLSFAFASDMVRRIQIEPLRRRLNDYLAATFRDKRVRS